MVNNTHLDSFYSSLSDATRRDILLKIYQQKLNLQDVAAGHKISLPAISKHLKVLEKAKLITREKVGREYRFTLTEAANYWAQQFDNLEKFLAKSS